MFPGMLLTYSLNDFEIVSVAPVITGITFVFYIPHAPYFIIIICNCCQITFFSFDDIYTPSNCTGRIFQPGLLFIDP